MTNKIIPKETRKALLEAKKAKKKKIEPLPRSPKAKGSESELE